MRIILTGDINKAVVKGVITIGFGEPNHVFVSDVSSDCGAAIRRPDADTIEIEYFDAKMMKLTSDDLFMRDQLRHYGDAK